MKSLVNVICESQNIPVTDWDLVIYEAVLAHNSTVNKSLKYSPFMCMFANNSQLPVDNFMGLKTNTGEEKLDGNRIMQDAKANMEDAKQQYKVQYDQNCLVNNYSVGQEVMMKRNYGDNPKIAVNWKRGPYYIERKIGPVNFAVRGPKGGSKVYHHNNLKPVLDNHEASRTAKYQIQSYSPESGIIESFPVIRIGEQTSVSTPILRDTMNTDGFRENVMSDDQSVSQERHVVQPVIPPQTVTTPQRSSSGRIIRQTKFLGVND